MGNYFSTTEPKDTGTHEPISRTTATPADTNEQTERRPTGTHEPTERFAERPTAGAHEPTERFAERPTGAHEPIDGGSCVSHEPTDGPTDTSGQTDRCRHSHKRTRMHGSTGQTGTTEPPPERILHGSTGATGTHESLCEYTGETGDAGGTGEYQPQRFYIRDDSGQFIMQFHGANILYQSGDHCGTEHVDTSSSLKTIAIYPPSASGRNFLRINTDSKSCADISHIWLRIENYDSVEDRRIQFVLCQPSMGPNGVRITDEIWQTLVRHTALMFAQLLDQVGFPIPELEQCTDAAEAVKIETITRALTEKNTILSPFRRTSFLTKSASMM